MTRDQELATLIIDWVEDHLMRQGRASELHQRNGIINAYRGEGDTKCAIGCLISDQDYDPKIEGKTVEQIFYLMPFHCSEAIESLLVRLQSLHDIDDITRWPIEFSELRDWVESGFTD
jgi:hypothetical protein